MWTECDQIGRFLMILETILRTKVAKIFSSFWGNLENITLLVTIAVTTFWATFGKIGLLFIATSDHTVLW